MTASRCPRNRTERVAPLLQVYNEACHDMYQKGAAVQAVLPVYEDDMEGYMVRAGWGRQDGVMCHDTQRCTCSCAFTSRVHLHAALRKPVELLCP